MNIVKPNTVWQVKKAIYGLREARLFWQGERDQQLRETLSLSIRTRKLTWSKVTFIPVYGLL